MAALRVLCAALALLVAVTAVDRPPILSVHGTHSEVYRVIGRMFKKSINATIDHLVSEETLAFYESPQGRADYNQMSATVHRKYPGYIHEMRGLADGAGVPFSHIMMANMHFELSTLQRKTVAFKGCSDVLVSNDNVTLIGHNEDGASVNVDHMGFINATFTDPRHPAWAPFDSEPFLAFAYPGVLAGNAFGWNQHGIAFTTNAVFPKEIDTRGTPRYILSRDLLNARSIEDAIERIMFAQPIASGFALNIGSLHEKRLVNVEIGPGFNMLVREVESGTLEHFNMYEALNVEQYDDTSTLHRRAAASRIPLPTDSRSIFDVLGDTSDATWPIYRNGHAPDTDTTLSTTLLDFEKGRIQVFLRNPKLYPEPDFTFPMTLEKDT